MKMEFPEIYIKRKRVKLHSGQYSNILYDVNALLTHYDAWIQVREKLKEVAFGCFHFVGIATGGAIIAAQFNTYKFWGMIKDGEYKGPEIKANHKYCLIDDVCTTESSIKEAIKIIDINPEKIFVVVDRRTKKTLKIESMYEV